jgi:predicted nucleotidyltransferase
MAEISKKVNEKINNILEIITGTLNCEKIYLFGSYAYGNPRKDSDLDFYIVYSDDHPLKPLETIIKITENIIVKGVGIPVDVLATNSSDFAEMSVLATLERKIAREGILLYEKQ